MNIEGTNQSVQAASDLTTKPQPVASRSDSACPQCHHINNVRVTFCDEDGQSLQEKTPCPHCGTPMFGKHNICEFCGEWLLERKCRHCGVDIEEGQLFCGDCGNMLKRIQCPQCGEYSGFEICINCGVPLTPTAKQMFVDQPLFLPTTSLTPSSSFSRDETSADPKAASSDHAGECLALKTYKDKHSSSSFGLGTVGNFRRNRRRSSNLFSDSKKDSIKRLEQEAVIEQRRQEEEEKLRQEEWRKKALMDRAEGTIYVNSLHVTITVKNEDGIDDDKFWLWVNDANIGYIAYSTGGRVSFSFEFAKGINLVELRFDKASGVGTVSSITMDPDGQQRRYGGSGNHLWMVIAK